MQGFDRHQWAGLAVRTLRVVVLLAVGFAAAQSMSRQYSLYTSHRTHRMDDVVTVIVDENNDATDDASTRTRSDSKAHAHAQKGQGMLGFLPSMNDESDLANKFDGQGKTTRQGRMNAIVSARVVEVLANGDLRVEGSKQVVVNEETEILSVSGIARVEDISVNNTVHSGRLAEAKVSYSGEGSTSAAADKGVLASFLDWLF
jgi:flagellar L-ring protein precursor FlgH